MSDEKPMGQVRSMSPPRCHEPSRSATAIRSHVSSTMTACMPPSGPCAVSRSDARIGPSQDRTKAAGAPPSDRWQVDPRSHHTAKPSAALHRETTSLLPD